MNNYEKTLTTLPANRKTWLVTGAAGFIGSNLIGQLLNSGQTVKAIDNFATGFKRNIGAVLSSVPSHQTSRFQFSEIDIRDYNAVAKVMQGVDYVLHQAALGSVPRSLKDPFETTNVNINGFLNVLNAALECNVDRFVYAASSSTYGDSVILPKQEENIGRPLSPYAVTKYTNELYADVFNSRFGLNSVGLRYFNVYGKHQTPDGPYAAVIPKWIAAMLEDRPVHINGDGTTSRDFCYINNVVQANLLAATVAPPGHHVYNVAHGCKTSLNELFAMLKAKLALKGHDYKRKPGYEDFRDGDVLHSLADITKIKTELGYNPQYDFSAGLNEALDWYLSDHELRQR